MSPVEDQGTKDLQLDRKAGGRGEQLVERADDETEVETAQEETVQLEPAPPISLRRSTREVSHPVRYTE